MPPLASALEAEVTAYIEEHQHERAEQGHRLVVRNGKARARTVTLGAGTVQVQTPRVDGRRVAETGQRQRLTFHSLSQLWRVQRGVLLRLRRRQGTGVPSGSLSPRRHRNTRRQLSGSCNR